MDTTSEPPVVENPRSRFPIRLTAGVVVVALLVLLTGVVITGIIVSRSSGADASGKEAITVAELRADPEGWDSQEVTLIGTAEDVRTLPYLDQYALYTFKDETGSMRVLSRNGAPDVADQTQFELRAVFHSRVTLDEALKLILKEQLGGIVGSIASSLIPDVPLDVVFLEHSSFEASE